MKTISLFISLLAGIGLYSFGQTDSIEKKAIFEKCLKGDLTQEEFHDLAIEWRKEIKKINGYPDLPLDQNKQVYFVYQFEYKGMMKIMIFNRVMEWISINYGPEETKNYANLSEGKIIFFGNFTFHLTHSAVTSGNPLTCDQTIIITIKDEKMLMEFSNFNYVFTIPGHYDLDNYIPDQNYNYPITSMYPVITKKSGMWDSYLEIFKKTKTEVESRFANLDNYITSYTSNYNF